MVIFSENWQKPFILYSRCVVDFSKACFLSRMIVWISLLSTSWYNLTALVILSSYFLNIRSFQTKYIFDNLIKNQTWQRLWAVSRRRLTTISAEATQSSFNKSRFDRSELKNEYKIKFISIFFNLMNPSYKI